MSTTDTKWTAYWFMSACHQSSFLNRLLEKKGPLSSAQIRFDGMLSGLDIYPVIRLERSLAEQVQDDPDFMRHVYRVVWAENLTQKINKPSFWGKLWQTWKKSTARDTFSEMADRHV